MSPSSTPSTRRTRRAGAALALPAAAALLVGAAAPAAADDVAYSKRSGERITLSWTEQDPKDLLRAPGNVHIGFLDLEDSKAQPFLFGVIDDFQCDPGEVPGHGEEGEGLCELVGQRTLESDDFAVTVVPTTRKARLTGVLAVTAGGHGGPGGVLARPRIDVTMVSQRLGRYSTTETWQDETYSYRSTVTGRMSSGRMSVRGSIGAMGFADDADDQSSGSFQTFTEVRRERWTR